MSYNDLKDVIIMKKWIWMILIIGLLASGLASQYLPKEDFQIYNSMKHSFDNYVDVTLQVIVNRKNYDVQEMIGKVYSFYCSQEPVNKLTIYLYESVNDLETGKIKAKQEFWNN